MHAAEHPDLPDPSTARVLEKAARLGLLSPEDAEVLRPAARLYHDLSQILRLCLPGPFDPKTAGAGLLRLLARAADVPDFADARCASARKRRRACAGASMRILGQAGGINASVCADFRLRPDRRNGSRTSTMVPTPWVERMRMVPPCSSTSDLAIARPRPEP